MPLPSPRTPWRSLSLPSPPLPTCLGQQAAQRLAVGGEARAVLTSEAEGAEFLWPPEVGRFSSVPSPWPLVGIARGSSPVFSSRIKIAKGDGKAGAWILPWGEPHRRQFETPCRPLGMTSARANLRRGAGGKDKQRGFFRTAIRFRDAFSITNMCILIGTMARPLRRGSAGRGSPEGAWV